MADATDQDYYRALLDDIEAEGEGLTDWERHFVEDVQRRDVITMGQAEKIEQIHKDRVG